jgi:predicted metal-binding membrane protein
MRRVARGTPEPCRNAVQRSRGSAAGAFRLGIGHGTHCLGCCWALMLILFAGGVMNLSVILTLTAWVLVEKAAPFGEHTPIASGVALLAMAGWMLVR